MLLLLIGPVGLGVPAVFALIAVDRLIVTGVSARSVCLSLGLFEVPDGVEVAAVLLGTRGNRRETAAPGWETAMSLSAAIGDGRDQAMGRLAC
jgi:hypothetical protein